MLRKIRRRQIRILLVGGGAREDALGEALAQSQHCKHLWIAPGNAGTARWGTNVDAAADDIEGIVRTAKRLKIDLVVVGPDRPLALGLVDRLQTEGVAVFGPTQAAAKIEWSKSFGREVTQAAGVPCPKSRTFSSYENALAYVQVSPMPVVVKADGLTVHGSGVGVCEDYKEAARMIKRCLVDHEFGEAGDTVLIQEFLLGKELSAFVLSDGKRASDLILVQDFKRQKDNDEGPMTGSMGSRAWPDKAIWTPELEAQILVIMQAVIHWLASMDTPFVGILYAGLMITHEGPKVLEFNARLGDTEAQVILPLLGSDIIENIAACIDGDIQASPVQWNRDEYCVGVAAATFPYPQEPAEPDWREVALPWLHRNYSWKKIFCAALWEGDDGKLWTISGRRVLTVVGKAKTLEGAIKYAYDIMRKVRIAPSKKDGSGWFYRLDIGRRVKKLLSR